MKSKLRSKAGMTLSETLVALAIVALIGVAMTVGITSASHIYRNATLAADAETLCSTIMTALEDELRFARNITEVTDGTNTTVEFDSDVFGAGASVFIDEGRIKIKNKIQANGSSYSLLSDAAYTDGLKASNAAISLNHDGTATINVKVEKTQGNNGKTYSAEHKVTVRLLND